MRGAYFSVDKWRWRGSLPASLLPASVALPSSAKPTFPLGGLPSISGSGIRQDLGGILILLSLSWMPLGSLWAFHEIIWGGAPRRDLEIGLLGLLLCLGRLQSGSLQLSLIPRSLCCLAVSLMCSWMVEFTNRIWIRNKEKFKHAVFLNIFSVLIPLFRDLQKWTVSSWRDCFTAAKTVKVPALKSTTWFWIIIQIPRGFQALGSFQSVFFLTLKNVLYYCMTRWFVLRVFNFT